MKTAMTMIGDGELLAEMAGTRHNQAIFYEILRFLGLRGCNTIVGNRAFECAATHGGIDSTACSLFAIRDTGTVTNTIPHHPSK